MLAREGSRLGSPEFFALEIIGGDEHSRLVEEAHVDGLTVGHWRARGMTVEPVDLLERGLENDLAPENLSAEAIKAEERTG